MTRTLKRLLPDWLLLIALGKAVGSVILLGF